MSGRVSSEPRSFGVSRRSTRSGNSTFEDVLEIFATHHADTVYIVDSARIVGVITRTDLFRVVDVVAVRPVSERSSVSIRSLMSPDPLVMTMEDTAAAAALSMWSRGLKSLPVVASEGGRLIGCIRAETVMQAVLRRVARPDGFPESAVTQKGVYVEGGVTVSG